jgi:undecaprenyl-diphosphatase
MAKASLKSLKWLKRTDIEKNRVLLPLLIIALIAAGIFLGIAAVVLTDAPLVQVDQSLYHLLQGLRTFWGDHLLVSVTELGDSAVNSGISVMVVAILLLRRQFFSAGFWILSIGGGACLIQLFKWVVQRPRPIDIYSGVSSWSFPSGHATMSVLIYVSLAILVVRGINPRWRVLPFVLAIGMSLLMAFSRIYLGAHWLSDVLGGLALGWSWVAFLSYIYLRCGSDKVPLRPLILTVFLALLLIGSQHIQSHHSRDMIRYQVSSEGCRI